MRNRNGTRGSLAMVGAGVLLAGLIPSVSAEEPSAPERFTATALEPTETIVGDLSKAARTADGRISVIVTLDDAPVASYTGGVKNLEPTNPKARGEKKLNLKSSATREYRRYLKGKQDDFAAAAADEVKGAKVVTHTDLALNAVSVIVPADDVATLATLPGVRGIFPDEIRTIDTDTSPTFIGATSAWQELGGQEDAGEGVIVGVLDTGVWPEHPSFADPDPSGKAYSAPPAAPDGSRACDFSGGSNPGAAFTCNNKLIGAERVMSTYDVAAGLTPDEFTTARDDDGHGTHTASTAAGNGGVAATIFGVSRGTVSGIAPRAHVQAYKVCGLVGCYSSDSVAAIQSAITDGVDVINFSISGGGNPYSDPVEVAFLGAYDAGVFVAASAGNSGPTPETTAHRGPWVTTVAASTHDRGILNRVELTADGGANLSLEGTSLTGGVGPAPVVVAVGDGLCLPTPAGTYTGKIVVCKRGLNGRVDKGKNVLDAGGVGMILYNQAPNVTDLETDNHFLPTTHLQFSQGSDVLAFLSSNTNVNATITPGANGSAQGDVMASFSSRGGPLQTLGISKPDITAPGVQILAGHSPQHADSAGGPQGELFQAIAGTSMSSPHIAGSGALIKALHPTWTAGQIKSALMTTARTAGLVKEDGSTPFTPFDAGSGRVDLTVADDPGLTFDATAAEYVALQDELYKANYPSIYHPAMPGVVTLTRTARSVLASSSTWSLKATGASDFKITVPKSLKVNAGATGAFAITMDASAVPLGETRFGTVTLTQTKGGNRVLHMPVTIVRGEAPILLAKSCNPTALAVGATTHCTLTATNPTFSDVSYQVRDQLPSKLKLDKASVVGGTTGGNDTVLASGTLPAAQPAQVSIAPGSTPAGGYLPLSTFSIAPIGGVGDETISNFSVPAFSFAGESWTSLGVVSNGYVVVGGGTGADVEFINQDLPDPNAPNNVLAGFWTDLNPAAAGAMRIGVLTDGADSWIVIEWEGVGEYTNAANTHSFQVWIGVDGDANPAEDVSYAYGPNTGSGDGGFATVGAENKFGNSGGSIYVDGTGSLPTNGTELRVTSTPGTSSSAVVTFDARAKNSRGAWTNCATLESDAFLGTSYTCLSGTVN